MVLNVDYDGTLNLTESGIELAKIVGKEKEGEKVYSHFLFETDKNLDDSKDIQEFIERQRSSCCKHLKEGAKLLGGSPPSIFLQVPIIPTPHVPKIIDLTNKNGGKIKAISYSDRRIVENYFEKIKIPCDYEIICNELEVENGKLTGNFLNMVSKRKNYNGGDVIGDSSGDIELFYLASQKGYKAYLLKNGKKSAQAERCLKKFNIPFTIF
jgi:phosphoserine phosphatase